MPKRPPWKYSMSKEQVERSEQEMFENFLDKIYDEYKISELSYFERNLEVNKMFFFRKKLLNNLVPYIHLLVMKKTNKFKLITVLISNH